MKLSPSLILRLASLLALALMLANCASPQASISIPQPTIPAARPLSSSLTTTTTTVSATDLLASPLPSPTFSLTQQSTPSDLAARISDSPLPSPPTDDLWSEYSLPQGISFTYPSDWQVDIVSSYPISNGIRTDLAVVPTQAPRYLGFMMTVYPLSLDQEASLYHKVGDSWTYRESPVFHVPWAQELRIRDLDWHLYAQGYSEGGLFVRRPDLDYLFEKGALTSATLIAIHYEKSKQLVVSIGQELTPDQLAMLDAQGMDAMYPEQFKVFSEILNTIIFSP